MKVLFLLFLFISSSYAGTKKGITPFFVSTKVSEANIRIGPKIDFPIRRIIIKNNIPLLVIDKYDVWYKVKDINKKTGWIHKSLVYRKKYIIIKSNKAFLYQNPKYNKVSFKLEKGVFGKALHCRANWCKVKIKKYKGWVKKSNIWGILKNEKL